jgi:RNA polymerase sigma factor (sigma-70 family)
MAARGIDGADPPPPSETLGQAYIRTYDEMRGFLRERTGSTDAAEELMQDVWVRIAKRADDTSIDNPDAWIQRIVINLSLTWLRRFRFNAIRHEPLPDDLAVADSQPDANHILMDRQRLDYLRHLVEEMPPRRRAVFVLYRGRGLSLNDTALHMGISIKTVKAQLAEAMSFLRQRMSEAGLWP